MKTFHLDILTPFKKYLSQDITFMHVRNEDSVLGILPNHAPIITTVEICELILKVEDRETKYAISGGVLSLKDNKATLLVDAIERFDEIDIDRAKSSRARALERLKNKETEIDVARAKASLARALVRLAVAGIELE